MRIRFLSILVIGLGLAFAGAARAVVLVNPDGTPVGGQWQQWADEMQVASLPGQVTVVPFSTLCGDDPQGTEGCADPYSAAIAVSPDVPEADQHFALLHELGHRFDWAYLTDTTRAQVRALLGYAPDYPWTEGFGVQDAFANAYALCAMTANTLPVVPASITTWSAGWGPSGSLDSVGRLCPLINEIGSAQNATPPVVVTPLTSIQPRPVPHRWLSRKRKRLHPKFAVRSRHATRRR